MSLQREAPLRLDGSKTLKPRGPRVRRLVSHFQSYAEAVEAGEFSRAIGPRSELASAGYEILYQRRQPKGGDQ